MRGTRTKQWGGAWESAQDGAEHQVSRWSLGGHQAPIRHPRVGCLCRFVGREARFAGRQAWIWRGRCGEGHVCGGDFRFEAAWLEWQSLGGASAVATTAALAVISGRMLDTVRQRCGHHSHDGKQAGGKESAVHGANLGFLAGFAS